MCNAVATDRKEVESRNPGELFSPIDNKILASASMARELKNFAKEEKSCYASTLKLDSLNDKNDEAKEVKNISLLAQSSKATASGISQCPAINVSGDRASTAAIQRFSNTSGPPILNDTTNTISSSVLDVPRVTKPAFALVKAKKKSSFLANMSMSLEELEDDDDEDEDEAAINSANNSSIMTGGSYLTFCAKKAASSYLEYDKKSNSSLCNNLHANSSDEDTIADAAVGFTGGTSITSFTSGSSSNDSETTTQKSLEDMEDGMEESSDDESIDLTQ